MKSLLVAIGLIIPLVASAAEDECDALFVLRAAKLELVAGKDLYLVGVDPNITWFCDRPVRQAGHMTLSALVELGSSGGNSFKDNPPNAAVSVFADDGSITDAVVTLTDPPQLVDEKVLFQVTEIDGQIPAVGGSTVLFIDPIGRPMSPTSRAGVHRRHVRRAVRY